MSDVRVVSSELTYKTKLFEVFHERAEGKDLVLDREIVKHPGAAVMMALDEQGRVLLVRQYRLPPREHLWELPAGTLDEGETQLETAKRELIEETGYRAQRWRKIVSFFPSPGFCNEEMFVFEARGLTEGEAKPEDYEKIELKWVKWEEAVNMVRRGRICDAKSIVAVLYYDQFIRRESPSPKKRASKKTAQKKAKR